MNVRRNVDVHADVEILELRVHAQRAHASADAERRAERSGSHGNAVADFEAGFNAVGSANLRILQNLAVGIAEQQLRVQRINADGVVRGIQVLKVIEIQAAAAAGGGR